MTASRRIPPLLSLRVFEAVARHLSFTAAAEELHVTQSAVSHHIKKPEEGLGRRLFERRTRAVVLTDDGRAYFEHVHAAFDLLRRGTEAMRTPRQAAGALTVGLLASFATRWLAPRLSAFHVQYPDVDLRLRPDIALADVAQGDVDVAIRYGRGGWSGVRAQKLMAERLSVVCAPSLIADHGPLKHPEDLLRFPILFSHTHWHVACDVALTFVVSVVEDEGSCDRARNLRRQGNNVETVDYGARKAHDFEADAGRRGRHGSTRVLRLFHIGVCRACRHGAARHHRVAGRPRAVDRRWPIDRGRRRLRPRTHRGGVG
jgi:DNA-binding transcriptional LysR family regulator